MSGQGRITKPTKMVVTPWPGSRVLSNLKRGAIVDIEAVEDGWISVYNHNTGHTGWIDRDDLQELPPPQPDALNIPPVEVPYDWRVFRSFGDFMTTAFTTLFLIGVGLSLAAMLGSLVWIIIQTIANM